MRKYGKTSAGVISLKKNFFEANEQKLDEAKAHAFAYKNQPLRKHCKICREKLPEPSFTKLGVDYAFCESCGHMCGSHEDTDNYCETIYTNNNGVNYARNYYEQDRDAYDRRVELIYVPKAEFLDAALNEKGENIVDMKLLDIGAGSGYFISALLRKGVTNIKGYEISAFQVKYANKMLGMDIIACNKPDEIPSIVKNTDVNIISLVGVMEHLQDPISVLQAIKDNKFIKYIFLCVPMFSLSVFLEVAFSQTVMPRHLTGGHTHLFTDNSLIYIENKFGFRRESEWWFGSDVMDLYRSIYIHQELHGNPKSMVERWKDYFHDEIDQLQLVLDKKHKSSQVHMLWRVI
jgi:SAM-dependent methyltransferase